MSIDRWMDKEDVVYIYNGILLSQKKNEIMPFAATWMNSRDCHTEWSKSDREREISYDIAYNWNLKRNDINELTKQKQTHRLREQNLWIPGRKG